jgi:tetratricopeptide (TPR) repeat protein
MRFARIVPLVLVVALAPAVFADDVKAPNWGPADVLLRADALPEGWSAATDEASAATAKEMEEAVKGLIQKEGIDDLYTEVDHVSIQNAAGAAVTLVLTAIDVDPKGLNAAAKALAGEKGWGYEELTTPLRFALLAGPEDARTAAWKAQIEFGVEALSVRAVKTWQDASRATSQEGVRSGLERAAGFARSAISLDDKAAMPHLILAELAASTAGEDKEKWAAAAAEFAKAFRDDATHKPDGKQALGALSQFGTALLMQKTADGNAEAKKVLTKALEYEKFDEEGGTRGEIRYNLACALSLLGEKEEAIKQLEAGLVAMKGAMPQDKFEEFVKDHIPHDTDLDNVRKEPGFDEAIKRVTGGSTAGGV